MKTRTKTGPQTRLWRDPRPDESHQWLAIHLSLGDLDLSGSVSVSRHPPWSESRSIAPSVPSASSSAATRNLSERSMETWVQVGNRSAQVHGNSSTRTMDDNGVDKYNHRGCTIESRCPSPAPRAAHARRAKHNINLSGIPANQAVAGMAVCS